jgi:hypothetical protein
MEQVCGAWLEAKPNQGLLPPQITIDFQSPILAISAILAIFL